MTDEAPRLELLCAQQVTRIRELEAAIRRSQRQLVVYSILLRAYHPVVTAARHWRTAEHAVVNKGRAGSKASHRRMVVAVEKRSGLMVALADFDKARLPEVPVVRDAQHYLRPMERE